MPSPSMGMGMGMGMLWQQSTSHSLGWFCHEAPDEHEEISG